MLRKQGNAAALTISLLCGTGAYAATTISGYDLGDEQSYAGMPVWMMTAVVLVIIMLCTCCIVACFLRHRYKDMYVQWLPEDPEDQSAYNDPNQRAQENHNRHGPSWTQRFAGGLKDRASIFAKVRPSTWARGRSTRGVSAINHGMFGGFVDSMFATRVKAENNRAGTLRKSPRRSTRASKMKKKLPGGGPGERTPSHQHGGRRTPTASTYDDKSESSFQGPKTPKDNLVSFNKKKGGPGGLHLHDTDSHNHLVPVGDKPNNPSVVNMGGGAQPSPTEIQLNMIPEGETTTEGFTSATDGEAPKTGSVISLGSVKHTE